MTIEKNNLDIPDYLDEEFFKAALQNGLKAKSIEIRNLNFTMGSGAGDNYSSNIYRVIVTYIENKDQPKTIPLIIKSILKGGIRDIIEKLDCYGKEVDMFFNIIPKMEMKLSDTKFAPTCYYTISEPLNTFVFEDLKASGFAMADRETGLDENHCKLLLEKLAKLHAVSMHMAKMQPQIFGKYKHGFITSSTIDSPIIQAFFVDSLRLAISVVEKWPNYEIYAEKMKNIYKNFSERSIAVTKPTPDEMKVLNHGDLWVNNFMFKYPKNDCKHPVDVSFFDYQGTYYTSPGIDINYFLNTSVQLEVLQNRREFLIEEYYYKTFRKALEKFKFETIPTLEDLQKEIRRKEFYGFISAVGILPVICMDRKDSVNMSIETIVDAKTGENKNLLAYQSKRFEEIMKYMLKRADDLGVLDEDKFD